MHASLLEELEPQLPIIALLKKWTPYSIDPSNFTLCRQNLSNSLQLTIAKVNKYMLSCQDAYEIVTTY